MVPPPPAAPPRARGPPERDGNGTRGLSQLQDGGASFNGISRGIGAHRAPPIGRVGARSWGGALFCRPANPASSLPRSAPFPGCPPSTPSAFTPVQRRPHPAPTSGQRRPHPSHPQLGGAAHYAPTTGQRLLPRQEQPPGPRAGLRPFLHRREPVKGCSSRTMVEVLPGMVAPAGRQSRGRADERAQRGCHRDRKKLALCAPREEKRPHRIHVHLLTDL
ncbi:hypothetical protein Nmel_008417 [Mimus melanotis]